MPLFNLHYYAISKLAHLKVCTLYLQVGTTVHVTGDS
jgi:hypothetical protein